MALLLLTAVAAFTLTNCTGDAESADDSAPKYAIALHGGAGVISKSMPDSVKALYRQGLEDALQTGEKLLREGAPALDVVEAVIRNLENNPRFNAGRGAVMTSQGKHELDAAIMDGTNREAGAITGVTTVKNPISLARKVMEESRHILFAADGAEKFADQMDVERVENSYFSTERRKRQWERAKERYEGQGTNQPQGSELEQPVWRDFPSLGTVGCVVLDAEGRLAAGTSTGGLTYKEYGRVGDVPIIGAGTYADSVVAVSATGTGEEIMRNVSGFHVSAVMQYKDANLEEAANHVIHERMNPGEAGIICVDSKGTITMPFNTRGMFRAAANSKGFRQVRIWENE